MTSPGDLVEPVAQLVHRHVHRAGDVAALELAWRPDVDHGHPAPLLVRHLVPLHGVGLPRRQVVGDEAQHRHRILRRAELGAYASSRSASPDAVTPPAIAVAITSMRLSTPSRPTPCAPRIASVAGSTSSFQTARLGTRVVPGVRLDARGWPGRGVRPRAAASRSSRCGGGQPEHPDDRRPQHRPRRDLPAGLLLGDEASVAVRGLRERHHRAPPETASAF